LAGAYGFISLQLSRKSSRIRKWLSEEFGRRRTGGRPGAVVRQAAALDLTEAGDEANAKPDTTIDSRRAKAAPARDLAGTARVL